MRIDHIEIQNFKCFEQAAFDLSPGFTLLLGDNAKGKTALLDAIAVAMGGFLLGIPGARSRTIGHTEVRYQSRRRGEILKFEKHHPVFVRAKGIVSGKKAEWKREKLSQTGRTTARNAKEISSIARSLAANIKEGQNSTLPLLVYYGTGRLFVEPKWGKAAKAAINAPRGGESTYAGYAGCLEPTSSVKLLRNWVQRMTLTQYQAGSGPSQSLAAVLGTISDMVVGAKHAFYDFEQEDLDLVFGRGKTWPLQLLSDGQRNMAGLAGDLAIRCVQLNPHLRGSAPKKTPGIVLIDEIDLHLHPKWQRAVISQLRKCFPKVQFVATTHSPFIVQSALGEGVIDLDTPEGLEHPREELSIEDIAEEIMDVDIPQRSQRFQQMATAAEEYLKALQDHPEDKSSVQRLKKKLDETETRFSDNPAYVAFLKLEREASGLSDSNGAKLENRRKR